MNDVTALEFDKILGQLSSFALSAGAREKIAQLSPSLSLSEAASRQLETADGVRLMRSLGSPPLAEMSPVAGCMEQAVLGAMLSPDELWQMGQFLATCGRMKRYLQRGEDAFIGVAAIGRNLSPLPEVTEEIQTAVSGGQIDDRASAALRDIRRQRLILTDRVKDRLNSLLRGNPQYFSDSFVVTRHGRLTLPVKKEYRARVPGAAVDTSGTGGTVFVEPAAVRALQEDLYQLTLDEENEIRRILYALTSLLAARDREIRLNREAMETLDFLFAKAKLALAMNGSRPELTLERRLVIVNGRHPLLDARAAVPLNISIEPPLRAVLITGPNTGGKTVVLKTAGLLSLMAQCGLHVPADEGSVFSLQNRICCDIGDGQSISENLSTFSAHMTNVIRILRQISDGSLVLLDELGSGTDPAEGMGLAVSILEELRGIGCMLLGTTHYPEIKTYAENTPGFANASMAFDKESLMPLYTLHMGVAGESNALYIAQRLGMPDYMLRRARAAARERTPGKTSYGEGDFAGQNALAAEAAPQVSAGAPLVKPEADELTKPRSRKFGVGDSVWVYPQKEIGLVYEMANAKGLVGVQIKGRKTLISHKRLKPHVAAAEMYPEDYDFAIVFDSVENRKKRREMDKGKVGVEIDTNL